MSESTELSVIEIKPEQAPVIYTTNGLDEYLNRIKAEVNEVPDLSTDKGRKRVASLSAQVSRSKTAIEKPGREYLKRLKEAVKPAEAEIKRFVDACDALRDEVRRPLTEWEAEQDRLKAEEDARKEAEALALKVVSDHEIALLMNDKFDRDLADKKAEEARQAAILAEQKKKEAEEREAAIRREAEEKAKRDAEAKAQAEIDAANQREAALKAIAEQAERDRIASEQKAEQDRIDAANKAEREKQEAIEAERKKAQEEADRIKRESEAKEAARILEEKRIKDEADKRAADVENRRAVNQKALSELVSEGIPEECAKKCIEAIAKGLITSIKINY